MSDLDLDLVNTKILTKELQNRFPRNVDVDKSATRPGYISYLELHFVHGDELASSITYRFVYSTRPA